VFGKTLYACTAKAPGGKSPFRKLFEADIRQRFGTDTAGKQGADCMIGRLRTSISEPDLINAQMDGEGTPGYDHLVGTRWAAAAHACNKILGYDKSIRAPHAEPRPPIH